MAFSTTQEEFWAGEFGDAYILRNSDARHRLGHWARMLERSAGVKSALELGANIGLNLRALGQLFPGCEMTGVEINAQAFRQLSEVPGVTAVHSSIFDFEPRRTFDLTFTSGVLIHIAPDRLDEVYEKLYRASHRYILLAEYYNPAPVEVTYRGHADRLFKRDFAGEMLDRFGDLQLRDYGFFYHRAPVFPADDATWFLMEKAGR